MTKGNNNAVRNLRYTRHPSAVAGLFAIILLALPPIGLAAADDTPTIDWGKDLYMSYCVSCHGWTAKGDGPAAVALKKTPSDLTQLSARNGGKFPRTEVKRYIDGETTIHAHGRREMPVWGKAFRREQSSANEARMQIRALATFLESIQAKPEP